MPIGAGVRISGDIKIIVEGLPELRKKCGGPPYIYANAVRKHQRNLANLGARMLRARATVATGRLKKSIRPKTDARGFLTGVNFNPIGTGGGRTSRADNGGFRSGWAMNSSNRYHPRNGGQTTHWIDDTAKELEGPANAEFAQAAREVEAAWKA